MLAEIKNTFPIQPDKRKIQTDQSKSEKDRKACPSNETHGT